MKKATVRDLRNHFTKLEAWLQEGEQIQIEKRGQPVAWLTGVSKQRSKPEKKPNFAARRKAIWGERIFSETEVQAMREAEREEEEG